MATIFQVAYKGRCEISQVSDANLSIVDVDNEDGAWQKYQQQYPDLPAIVISNSPAAAIDGVCFVAKPVNLNLLWEYVVNMVTGLPPVSAITNKPNAAPKQANAQQPADSTPHKENKNASGVSSAASSMDGKFKTTKTGSRIMQGKASQQDESLYFDPEEYLLGRIVTAVRNNSGSPCAIHVQCWAGRRCILLPAKGLAFTDLTDSQLKNLGVATINKEFTVAINTVSGPGTDDLPASETEGLQKLSIDHLIWDLALRTSRGRVPQNTDLNQKQYLRCWPNFPRLPRTPHAMRIAALWVDNPRLLDEIARTLGIDKADVYSFYSAASATGLVGPARRQVDNLFAPRDIVKNEISRRGLLASILRHISH